MKGTNMETKTRFSLRYFAFALLGVMIVHNLWIGVRETLNESELERMRAAVAPLPEAA